MILLAVACLKPVALPEAGAASSPSTAALQSYDHNAREHALRAYAQLEAGQLEEAAASFKRALLFDPESALLYFELGSVREQLGELEAATTWYEEAAARGSEAAVQRLQALAQDPG